jgi:hypothetical protein
MIYVRDFTMYVRDFTMYVRDFTMYVTYILHNFTGFVENKHFSHTLTFVDVHTHYTVPENAGYSLQLRKTSRTPPASILTDTKTSLLLQSPNLIFQSFPLSPGRTLDASIIMLDYI